MATAYERLRELVMHENKALQELSDYRALYEAMTQYARCLDQRDWRGLDDVFAINAVADYDDEAPKRGRESIVRGIRRYLDDCGPTQHLLGNFSAELLEERAITRTYARIYHMAREGSTAHLETFGEYLVQWQRQEAGWRAVHWRLNLAANRGDPAVLGL